MDSSVTSQVKDASLGTSQQSKQWLVFRTEQLSLRLDKRVPSVLLALIIATLATMVWSVGQGEYPVPPLDVIRTVFGLPTDNADYAFIVNTLRLPRTLVAWGVGVGLSIAGTLTQAISRNPLASPDIIGINAGAALAAVSLIVVFPTTPISVLPLAAMGGALSVAVLIYLLAWQGRSFSSSARFSRNWAELYSDRTDGFDGDVWRYL